MPKCAVLEAVIIDKPDFNHLDLLSQRIYEKTLEVTDEITEY
jgi:hypothetical protein